MATLTDAEMKIMEILWGSAPKTLMELTRLLSSTTGWTKQTIITLLKRMMEKGTVRAQEIGRTKYFYPCVTREQIVREQTHSLLSWLFDGRASLLVANMAEEGDLTREELDALQRIIDQAREEALKEEAAKTQKKRPDPKEEGEKC